MFYSRLRWEVHDLKKDLEFEKQLNKRLIDDARMDTITINGLRARIKELEDLLKAALGAKDKGDNDA